MQIFRICYHKFVKNLNYISLRYNIFEKARRLRYAFFSLSIPTRITSPKIYICTHNEVNILARANWQVIFRPGSLIPSMFTS
ncbi:unnamed protein product [Allacma fusca]|uniref:Uncharacterized protein n=1 Tax=Allacma fusca TaxID=39272 RepID=A0A8J2P1L8_9HEXA|nr:unnamed protein product [Allacma fusca]